MGTSTGTYTPTLSSAHSEDLPSAMADRDRLWKRVKGICAVGSPWWWWGGGGGNDKKI